jgi:hypothetical protein
VLALLQDIEKFKISMFRQLEPLEDFIEVTDEKLHE